MAQPRVFVSYNHNDDAFTRRLVSDLKQAGASVWVDVANIGAGDFLDRINNALDSCEWVVLVLTKDAVASPYVRQEVHAAFRLKNMGRINEIIAIKAAPLDDHDIPPLWGILNIFDATRDYTSARDAVLSALGLRSGPQALGDMSALGHAAAILAVPLVGEVVAGAIGRVWQSRNRAQINLAEAEAALAANPKDAAAWSKKGDALAGLWRFGEAVEAYERALILDPNNATAWNKAGEALNVLKRHAEALTCAERALQLGKSQEYWRTKADALRGLGREADAQEADRRASVRGT